MRVSTLVLLASFPLAQVSAGDSARAANDRDTSQQRRIVEAVRVSSAIALDGRLTEEAWRRLPVSGFTQRDPVENVPPSNNTEVWVAYDDAAVYVAARLHDARPDSIVSRIGRRDAYLSADYFLVSIDSYHDRRTGFYFKVYSSGAIADGTLFNDSWDSDSWDGVWEAATATDSLGWTVEMQIPFSQLRFAKQAQYVWGINFTRTIDRYQERSDYVMVPKSQDGWVSRFADLVGIRDINPPARLELLPYTVSKSSFTNQFSPGDPFHREVSFGANMGADMRLGLGNNLTLNATINPDFGQVEVDPAVVNLSQFETFFDEKRPFFIEGSSFFDFGFGGANNNWGFNWGSPEYFYSRRIGRPPQGRLQHSGFADVPDGTTILGAAKLTGKIGDDWSVGTLHALTQEEHAEVENGGRYDDVVEPFSSYNVLRTLREFNKGKQAIGVLGTATLRNLNQPYLVDQFNRQSYAFGVDGWTNIDSAGEYVVTGWLSATHVRGTTDRILALQQAPLHYYQRPDVDYVRIDSSATSMTGYAGRVAVNHQRGNFRFNSAVGFITPGFETNDLGYLFRTDIINMHVVAGYRWYEPDGFFRSKGFNLATFRNFTFGNPSSPGGAPSFLGGYKTGEGYFFFYNAQFMNYWTVDGNIAFNPGVIDMRYTRGGPMMKTTNSYSGFISGQTDSRQGIVYSLGVEGSRAESGGYYWSTYPGLELKPSSNLSITLSPQFYRNHSMAQFVKHQADAAATATYGTRYVFGMIDQYEYSSSVRVDWTFNPKLSLQVYLQPLISVGTYDQFKELRTPGTFTFNQYGVDNGSSIQQVDRDQMFDPDGGGPLDSVSISAGDYLVDPGTGARFRIGNPDFNFKSLRTNIVLRLEYLPGSTIYLVYTRSGVNLDHPGEFNFGRDLGKLLSAPDHDDAILLKIAYWWHP